MSTQPTEIKENNLDDAERKRTRRTEGLLKGDRQERVVESVLRETALQLSRNGYEGLRVDDVAAASGVNKTTIYRRWPSKPELVAAALEATRAMKEVAETGNLREDLIAMMLKTAEFASSPTGRGIVRILQIERAHPEVEKIALDLRTRQRAARKAMIERAILRGELPAGTDAALVAELLFAPLFGRCVSFGEPVDEPFARSVVDTVLAGVHALAAASK
jgi:AcrR family transcriptional regulator